MASPVWLYVPNLIGYTRILTGLAAFYYSYDSSKWWNFFVLYFISYSLDALDGVAARALKQTSRFGAVLDMVWSGSLPLYLGNQTLVFTAE
jgi:CDP-diacylglycerol--inositol 3-phosphatidyltransferase